MENLVDVINPGFIERRKNWCSPDDCNGRMQAVSLRLAEGDDRMKRIEAGQARLESALTSNTTQTQETYATVAEVLDILRAGKGFFKVLGWFMGAFKYILAFLAPIAAIYVAWKKSQ